MKIVVLKFGGTSVGTIDRIKKVANIISTYKKKGYQVVVVSSAMSGYTNDLIKKSENVAENFKKSEYDTLVSAGEQISCSLIAGRLSHIGHFSKSMMGWQIPIYTDDNYSNAKIKGVNTSKIKEYLKQGGIPIIAGFQGIDKNERITTLGRGGSDYSAIVLAKYLKAIKCVIYTDVIGVMTTDPKVYKRARKIKVISYEEMLEMSSLGSKVMQSNSVQDARLNRIDVNVKSSFVKNVGTLITKRKNIIDHKVITGISVTKSDSKITLVGVVDRPGVAASVFEPLSVNNINVDMVVQNISADGHKTDITFTINSKDLNKTQKLIKYNKRINFKDKLTCLFLK